MKGKNRQQRDVVRRPAPNRPQDTTQEVFNIVRRECQGTGPKLKRAGRRMR